MAIKHYKPTTNGLRNMTTMDYSGLSKVAPERSLISDVFQRLIPFTLRFHQIY